MLPSGAECGPVFFIFVYFRCTFPKRYIFFRTSCPLKRPPSSHFPPTFLSPVNGHATGATDAVTATAESLWRASVSEICSSVCPLLCAVTRACVFSFTDTAVAPSLAMCQICVEAARPRYIPAAHETGVFRLPWDVCVTLCAFAFLFLERRCGVALFASLAHAPEKTQPLKI